MALHLTPEEHNANPPQTWQVVKRAERIWHLCDKDGRTISSFTTKRDAEAAKSSGFYADLYAKEGRWFAGGSVIGWKPYRPA